MSATRTTAIGGYARPTRRARPTKRAAPGLVVLGAVLAALAGCDGKAAPSPPVAAGTATPSPSVDASTAAAGQAAIAAYYGYFQAYAQASAAGDPDDPNLPRYTGDPLLSLTRHNIRVDFADRGTVQVGTPKSTATISKVDLASRPAMVTLAVCLNYSGLSLAYKFNHSPVPNSSLGGSRFAGSATVTQYPDGRWLVTQATSVRELPC